MQGRILGACALAGLYYAQGGTAAPITDAPLVPRATATGDPYDIGCGWASSASKSYLAKHTDAPQARIPAELAYNCLKSIPNYQEPAIALLKSLRVYLEFQSNIEYLKKPPPGYLYPAVDLLGEFEAIQAQVDNGGYESEYDMQLAITTLLNSVHDGHLFWSGDVVNSFYFFRSVGLVSLSSDGVELPQIYVTSDILKADNETGALGPRTDISPSPLVEIDGVDVVSFLLEQSFQGTSQDPDANWNNVFSQLGRSADAFWQVPQYYPGPTTTLTFANGSTLEIKNEALVMADLTHLANGADAYTQFCPGAFETVPATMEPSSTVEYTTSMEETATPTPTPALETEPGYPYPAIIHSDASIAGYYLNDTDYEDIAVLRINSFAGSDSSASLNYQEEFQLVLENFLSAAVKLGKKKLIIDLLGNGGGYIDSGTDTFAQLFPSIPPNSKSDMRNNLGLWVAGNTASNIIKAAEATPDETDEDFYENQFVPIAFQTIVDPTYHFYPTFQSFYGPYERHGGGFFGFFQNNYTDPNSSDYLGQGIIVTGTNNRTGFTQPFAAQDMIVVYDGYCASTCTVVSEYLKNYAGVQFIAVGGRPQTGPMQALGGVKGSQVFQFDSYITSWVDLWANASETLLAEAEGTIWEDFNTLPVLREFNFAGGAVNGRNHFRMNERTTTPLQFVYEAADCRIWWTPEMLYDPVFLWNRVAEIAFKERKGSQFNSHYCIKDSTGHPTSISGGWEKSTLGPQSPPNASFATTKGWKLEGKPVEGHGGDPGEVVGEGSTKIEGNLVVESSALQSMRSACDGYSGDAWFLKLMCNALNG